MEDIFEDKEETRPRISGELAEEVIEEPEKSFEENLKEKLGLDL